MTFEHSSVNVNRKWSCEPILLCKLTTTQRLCNTQSNRWFLCNHDYNARLFNIFWSWTCCIIKRRDLVIVPWIHFHLVKKDLFIILNILVKFLITIGCFMLTCIGSGEWFWSVADNRFIKLLFLFDLLILFVNKLLLFFFHWLITLLILIGFMCGRLRFSALLFGFVSIFSYFLRFVNLLFFLNFVNLLFLLIICFLFWRYLPHFFSFFNKFSVLNRFLLSLSVVRIFLIIRV